MTDTEANKALVKKYLTAIDEGDLIAVRTPVTGTQHGPFGELTATGHRVDFTALQLFRVEGGVIAEHWEIFDETTLTQQVSA